MIFSPFLLVKAEMISWFYQRKGDFLCLKRK